MRRGQRGGFRVIAYYSPEEKTLYPLMVYTHQIYEGQPPDQEIKSALQSLLGELAERQRRLFDQRDNDG